MRTWYDEKLGCNCCEPDCAEEWLKMVWAIGVDYDGCNTVDSLQDLVDELVDMAQKARDCLRKGYLFSANIEEEDFK